MSQFVPPGFDEDRDYGNEPEAERTEAEIEAERARWAELAADTSEPDF